MNRQGKNCTAYFSSVDFQTNLQYHNKLHRISIILLLLQVLYNDDFFISKIVRIHDKISLY